MDRGCYIRACESEMLEVVAFLGAKSSAGKVVEAASLFPLLLQDPALPLHPGPFFPLMAAKAFEFLGHT